MIYEVNDKSTFLFVLLIHIKKNQEKDLYKKKYFNKLVTIKYFSTIFYKIKKEFVDAISKKKQVYLFIFNDFVLSIVDEYHFLLDEFYLMQFPLL